MTPATDPYPDECEECGSRQGEVALRSIKMRGGTRETLCEGCFIHKRADDEVHPSDPRLNRGEVRR